MLNHNNDIINIVNCIRKCVRYHFLCTLRLHVALSVALPDASPQSMQITDSNLLLSPPLLSKCILNSAVPPFVSTFSLNRDAFQWKCFSFSTKKTRKIYFWRCLFPLSSLAFMSIGYESVSRINALNTI